MLPEKPTSTLRAVAVASTALSLQHIIGIDRPAAP